MWKWSRGEKKCVFVRKINLIWTSFQIIFQRCISSGIRVWWKKDYRKTNVCIWSPLVSVSRNIFSDLTHTKICICMCMCKCYAIWIYILSVLHIILVPGFRKGRFVPRKFVLFLILCTISLQYLEKTFWYKLWISLINPNGSF